MIEKGIKIFLGLAALIYIVNHPAAVVDVAQVVIDAAVSFGNAVAHLDTPFK